jgi:hypothetical protein
MVTAAATATATEPTAAAEPVMVVETAESEA